MKFSFRTIAFVLCCILAIHPFAKAEPSIQIAGVTTSSKACRAFMEENPNVHVQAVLTPFQSTTELINALLTRSFVYDDFLVSSNRFDIDTLIEKGYVLDLSAYPGVTEAVTHMSPAIAALVTRGNAIYGIPYHCAIQYMAYNPAAWEALALSDEDVPDSFPSFLRFLEKWIAYAQINDVQDYAVFASFDEELYDATTYADCLVRLLMEEQTRQCAYANQPLRFDTPDFRENLERCLQIGLALYQLEPEPNRGQPLFTWTQGMERLEQFVPLRLTAEQPPLIPCTVNVCMVYTSTAVPELAAAFAMDTLKHYETNTNIAYLYAEADPVENPGYTADVAFWEETVAGLRARLSVEKMQPAEYLELTDELARCEKVLAEVSSEDNRYQISAAQLACYHAYQEKLLIQPPHIFLSRNGEEQHVASLRRQYVSGLISADQLVNKLDQTAYMLEMEAY